MLAVKGVYRDGRVVISREVKTDRPVNVVVTFLEEIMEPVEKKLDINKFSFKKAKELLGNFKGSLSDVIIEERRSAL